MKNAGVVVVVSLCAVLGVSLWPGEHFRALEYDAKQTFKVGKHRIAIETRSFSITSGDNGPAEVIVSCHDGDTTMKSSFNADLFSDLRPAYVSWEDIDHDWYRDLVIWKPGSIRGLEANEFISSVDGQLHVMRMQRQRPLADAFGVW